MPVNVPESLGDALQSLDIHGDSAKDTLPTGDLPETPAKGTSPVLEGFDNRLWMTLPAELFVEIFQHANRSPKALSPLQLGEVCRAWRNLVFNSCQLWTRVELRLAPSRYNSQLLLLEQWLERARDVPLALNISWVPRLTLHLSDEEAGMVEDRLISTIAGKSSQITNLNLYVPGAIYTRLSKSPISFGALNELFISTHGEESNDIKESPVRTFESSTQLTDVTIRHFYISSFSLPWAQLLHLKFRLVTPHEICEAILWSPNLQTLDVDFVVEGPDSAGDIVLPPTITHHNLTRFTFSENEEAGLLLFAADAFNRLRLPKLQSFTFILGDNKFLLYPFVSASMFPLEELSIQSVCIVQSDLIDCLQLLPSLRLLDLESIEWSNLEFMGEEIFQLMTNVPGERSPILPNLQSFTLGGSKVGFAPDVFVALLKSRWGPPAMFVDDGTPLGHSSLQTVDFRAEGPLWEITESHELIFDGWRGMGFSIEVIDSRGQYYGWL